MRWSLLCLLLAGCRIYDPMPIDCQISCGAREACPERTTCREGSCRTEGSSGRCECRTGEERPCGEALGTCRQGVEHCVGNQWGVCEGAVIARAESCNGLDDDCDGAVDDEIALPPPCALTLGVCSEIRSLCIEATWRACDRKAYGPFYEPEEVTCDGRDNDCDGVIDGQSIVELASGNRGPWFFLTTTMGFALVSNTDTGAELRWLSKDLAPRALLMTTIPAAVATSRGDTLILAAITDAGVVFTDFEADGGSSARTEPAWSAPDALDLSVDFAAASVNGEVQLLSLRDGGAPVSLGPDTTGAVRLSQTGWTLAWSQGLSSTSDFTFLRMGVLEPLISLIDLRRTIAGVPVAQPAQTVFFPDLIAGTPAQSTGFVVPSFDIHGTEHLGGLLLVGIEAPNALWLGTARGTQRRVIAGGLSSVRVTPSHDAMAALAWEKSGTIWAVRQCGP